MSVLAEFVDGFVITGLKLNWLLLLEFTGNWFDASPFASDLLLLNECALIVVEERELLTTCFGNANEEAMLGLTLRLAWLFSVTKEGFAEEEILVVDWIAAAAVSDRVLRCSFFLSVSVFDDAIFTWF